ncbi:TSUP family transporter [Paradesertivirga mongoliensis]|uniref:Probable membrane transporter protein n=1 Tax=Paradesertivirga mongoliensis TaxID=2100740 RepID=A0ABW4ZKG6_9SPHI|nr:TSUP family transporter [Pedobacter mongoliensis]
MSGTITEEHLVASTYKEHNTLFPIFLKLENLTTLIVGGGYVATEKLTALFQNSPQAVVRLVATQISPEVKSLITRHNIHFEERAFSPTDLEGIDLAIIAIDDKNTSAEIHSACLESGVLTNVADKPELCDFYLSSIVQKGNLKIAISTNGKSPTIAKRVKEVLTEAIPPEMEDVLDNMEKIRQRLGGDFSDKVRQLNDITSVLAVKTEPETRQHKKLVHYLLYSGAAICLMVLGHLFFTYINFENISVASEWVSQQVTSEIFIYILGGFIAQMIDGALGMAYGVSATTFLMSFGVPAAAASASVHTSEIFTSGVSGLMHLRFGNVNSKLFKNLLLPGIVGAILGAYILTSLENYNSYIKPIVAMYTMTLGIVIIRKALAAKRRKKKTKNVGILAIVGGFLDSVGGGGWGPIVTSTLLAGGRNARFTIGSVNLAEFFVAFASSVTFSIFLGMGTYFQIILGLVVGGMIAAPIAASLSSRLPVKTIMLIVGIVIIIVSLNTFRKYI